jgi:DNA-directed RNA polymerase I subunit RPA49
MRELRNDLGQTFGTKKAKKAIASVTENAISPDKTLRALSNGGKGVKVTSADSAMLAILAESTKGMASREDLAKAADEGKPRPKANLEATNVKDVYTIDSLIGTDVFQLIPVKKWTDSIKAKREIFVSNSYVGSRIMNASSSVEKLKLLRFMNFLLSLRSACRSQRGSLALPRRDEIMKLLEDMPEAIFESVRRKFADGGIMSKYQIDLLITHICAMACIVDNYEVDTWLLKEDLKLETKQMQQYFLEIGAKVVGLGEVERRKQGLEKAAAAQHKVAKLKLPLEFPKVSFGRKR